MRAQPPMAARTAKPAMATIVDTDNAEDICNLCEQPACFEKILKAVFDKYGMKMSFEQYALVGSTVKSYLTWLKNEGKVTARFEDNMLLWEKRAD